MDAETIKKLRELNKLKPLAWRWAWKTTGSPLEQRFADPDLYMWTYSDTPPRHPEKQDIEPLYSEAEVLSLIEALDTQSSRTETMRKALKKLLHAVCSESGFANAVRTVSGTAYPWPALDIAEEEARLALSTSNPGDADGWRAIETAPKDGTVIHVWASGFQWPEAVRWEDYSAELAEELAEDGYWTYAEDLMADATESCEPETWTHWRPLPTPPASSLREGSQ